MGRRSFGWSKTNKYGAVRRDLSWRYGKHEVDTNLRGEPVPNNYIVIVKVKDCEVIDRYPTGETRTIRTSSAPQGIKINHNATYSGYGEWKQVKSNRERYIVDTNNPEYSGWVKIFYRCIKYTVYDNRVYAQSIFSVKMPGIIIKESTRKVLVEKT